MLDVGRSNLHARPPAAQALVDEVDRRRDPLLCSHLHLHSPCTFAGGNKVYEPYAEARNRATVERLLAAGFRCITLAATRPTEPLHTPVPAQIVAAPGGLPADLALALVAAPLPPASATHITAARETSATLPYLVGFHLAALPDEKEELARRANLYARRQACARAQFRARARRPARAITRDRGAPHRTLAGVLPPGRYLVTLVATRESRTWALTVK